MTSTHALRLRVEVVLVAATSRVHEPGARCFGRVVEPLLSAHFACSWCWFEHAEGVPGLFNNGQCDRGRIFAALACVSDVGTYSTVVVTVVQSRVPTGRHTTVFLLGQTNVVTAPVLDKGHGVHPGSDLVPLAARHTARTPLGPSCDFTLLIASLQLQHGDGVPQRVPPSAQKKATVSRT